MLNYEYECVKKGITTIAGLDEVGRGCLAGPVVVGVVISSDILSISLNELPIVVRDSKKMTAKQREVSNIWIKKHLECGVGEASNHEIDTFGIVPATHLAARRAVENTSSAVEHLLLDAFYIPDLPGISEANQTAIVKGDNKSFLIACASIIAKVHRDTLMKNIANNTPYSHYSWQTNVGYGTKAHKKAIQEYGLCDLHRKSFCKSS